MKTIKCIFTLLLLCSVLNIGHSDLVMALGDSHKPEKQVNELMTKKRSINLSTTKIANSNRNERGYFR